MKSMRPMEAVAALYGESDGRGSSASDVFRALSHAVFDDPAPTPSGRFRQCMARLSYRVVQRTTKPAAAGEATAFRCAILERSGHPYAQSLLAPSREDIAALVEGGDPMNGPYMMIIPEVRRAGDRWDSLFFNSVQGRDVQLRFIWETRTTHAEAARRLAAGHPVRLKAVAAGTGLSLLLVIDRLLEEGHEAARISVALSDREESNTAKTRRLASQLPNLRDHLAAAPAAGRIAIFSEDAFAAGGVAGGYDVVTAVGIFEYLQGHSCETTESRLGRPEPKESADASRLASVLAELTAPDGSLIVNTYRPHHTVRLLEVFGKTFDYRTRENMASLLAGAGFRPAALTGSGNIYDVEVYKKCVA